MFVEDFSATFKHSNNECTSTSNSQVFRQEPHLAIMYALDFKQLAYDISWDEIALMNQFQYGLRNNVKDLLLNMSNFPH